MPRHRGDCCEYATDSSDRLPFKCPVLTSAKTEVAGRTRKKNCPPEKIRWGLRVYAGVSVLVNDVDHDRVQGPGTGKSGKQRRRLAGRAVSVNLRMARNPTLTPPPPIDLGDARREKDRARQARPLRLMGEDQASGLQRVVLNERARLLRFLAARGAGEEAEDLLHELWERVAANTGQPISDPVSYLFRAAENLMRDRHRSRASRERRQFDWHEMVATSEVEPIGERVLIARERLQAVDAALEKLGPRVSQVFRRYRIEGVSQSAIARDLGISLSSVEKDLQKAYRLVAKLKAKFDAE